MWIFCSNPLKLSFGRMRHLTESLSLRVYQSLMVTIPKIDPSTCRSRAMSRGRDSSVGGLWSVRDGCWLPLTVSQSQVSESDFNIIKNPACSDEKMFRFLTDIKKRTHDAKVSLGFAPSRARTSLYFQKT